MFGLSVLVSHEVSFSIWVEMLISQWVLQCLFLLILWVLCYSLAYLCCFWLLFCCFLGVFILFLEQSYLCPQFYFIFYTYTKHKHRHTHIYIYACMYICTVCLGFIHNLLQALVLVRGQDGGWVCLVGISTIWLVFHFLIIWSCKYFYVWAHVHHFFNNLCFFSSSFICSC